jgi:hypothetical protein
VPGETSFAEAKARLIEAFGNSAEYDLEMHEASSKVIFGVTDKLPGRTLYRMFGDITEFEQSQKVDRLTFSVEPNAAHYLSLVDLYPMLGNPQFVQESIDYYGQTLLTFNGARVLVIAYPLPCGAISTESRLQFVISQGKPQPAQRDANFLPWKGFNQCYRAR